MACRTIGIVNQKGGVGKTTTALNLSVALALEGKSVLLIDFDPQGSLSIHAGLTVKEGQKSLADEMLRIVRSFSAPVINRDGIDYEAITVHIRDGLDFMPTNIMLYVLEAELSNAMMREFALKSALEPIREKYEFIVIDANSSLGPLVINVLTASDEIIIPSKAEYLDVSGVALLLSSGVNRVRYGSNPGIRICGILLTMVEERLRNFKEIRAALSESAGDNGIYIFDTVISRTTKYSKSSARGMSMLEYDPKSKHASEFISLAREVIKRHVPN